MLSPQQIRDKVTHLKSDYAERDTRYSDILRVRGGASHDVYPDLFPEMWPKPIIANFCDVAARDLAELIAPLPAFNCMSANMVSDKAKDFADKRTKVVHSYLEHSKAAKQMYRAADWYISYGMIVAVIEPDWKHKTPIIRFDDPYMCYPEFDRFDRVLSYTKVYVKSAEKLARDYPEYASQILNNNNPFQPGSRESQLELISYMDDEQFVMLIPARGNLVVNQMPNPFGKVPVKIAKRPSIDDDIRGQFDDMLWVQLAKARMAVLGMEAAEKSVQAPLALPQDVQEMAFGPDAILRSATPEKIRRVGIEMSPAAMQEQSLLENEIRVGARYPEARSGIPGGSQITGRGIQELMGGFDTQIKAAQEILRELFKEIVGLCFRMDELFWPNEVKKIRGEMQGAPFDLTYTPAKDIKGDYTCDVTYGLAAGMDPNRWLVFMLQLRGDRLIPREFVQRNLPMDVNVQQLMQQLDIEESRDAVKQAAFGLAQAVPAMIAQGQPMNDVMKPFVTLIQQLQKGKPFEDAAITAWTPEAPPPGQQTPGQPGEQPPGPGGPGQPNPQMGQPGGGLTPGVAPGQEGQGPGGRPNLQQLLAGLSSSGKPNLQANVARRVPAQ